MAAKQIIYERKFMVYHRLCIHKHLASLRSMMVFGLCSGLKFAYICSGGVSILNFMGISTKHKLVLLALLVLSSVCFQVFRARSYDNFHAISHINYTIYLRIMDFVVAGILFWTGTVIVLALIIISCILC